MRGVEWGDGLTGRAGVYLVGAITLLLVGNAVALAAYDGGTDEGTGAGGNGQAVSAEQLAAGEERQPGPGDGAAASAGSTTTAAPPVTAKAKGGAKGTKAPTTPTSVFDFTYETTPPRPFNPYTYDVTILPTCAVVGQPLTVTFRIEPGYAASFFVIYGDGHHHDKYWGGNADLTGVATHSWTAPPVLGYGRAYTVAYGSNNRTGKTTLDFRIVETPGECGS